MKQHRFVLLLQEFEGPSEQRNVVPIDRTVITEAELFEDDTRQEKAFHPFFDLVREV